MFSITYDLNDISDIAFPKTNRHCINSLKTAMSAGDYGFSLKSKSISATHWKPMGAYKGIASSYSSCTFINF